MEFKSKATIEGIGQKKTLPGLSRKFPWQSLGRCGEGYVESVCWCLKGGGSPVAVLPHGVLCARSLPRCLLLTLVILAAPCVLLPPPLLLLLPHACTQATAAVRDTARRVKKRQVGKGWGPKSGINDAPKLLGSVALVVGSALAPRALEMWVPSGLDPVVLFVIEMVAGFAVLRALFFALRRPLLRLLLRAQPWAHAQNSPLSVALWETSLALLQPANASTGFLARVLPPLPGPGPVRALQHFLDALAPTSSTPARDAAAEAARELLRAGPKLLEQDVGRCAEADGSDWAWACTWKEPLIHDDAHLLGRCYYLLDRQVVPEGTQGKQATRAAVLTMRLLDFMKRVGNFSIPCRGLMCRAHPVPKIVPRCVQAFDTLFATSIEPLDTADATLHRRDFQRCSHYIVVLCHGQAVEVPVRDASGARVSEGQLVKLLVSAEAAAKVFLFYPLLFALSAQRRDAARKEERLWELDTLAWLPWSEWGEVIAGLHIEAGVKFKSDGVRTETRAIENFWMAALVLALDSTLPSWPQAQDSLSNRALSLLLGPSPACRGTGRWRCGAFCLVVQPDGYAGLCCTLPLAEPWAAAQMWEFALAKERYPISLADVDAEVLAPKCLRTETFSGASAEVMRRQLETSRAAFVSAAQGMSLRVLHIKNVGWRVLQRLKVAPAALIQLAAQVALYRVQGAVAFSSIVLDSVPTRLFLGGRSDWVCTTTKAVVDFVSAFCDGIPKTGSAQARTATRSLLVQACKSLDHLQRQTALGRGFYSFLMALRGSSTNNRRLSLLRTLLPLRGQSDGIPAVGLCTWLCEVQTDPKTPTDALSLGGGGGFSIAGAAGGCRIGVAPVGDAELVVHVSCSHPVAVPPPTQCENADQDDDFVDCLELAEDGGGSKVDGAHGGISKAAGGGAGRGSHSVSADSVAREMERALQELVELLQHKA